jgi:hypothetical protein
MLFKLMTPLKLMTLLNLMLLIPLMLMTLLMLMTPLIQKLTLSPPDGQEVERGWEHFLHNRKPPRQGAAK